MRTFHRHPAAEVPAAYPWQRAHAAPEDRAVGLELELIELVRRRGDAPDGEQADLDHDIDGVLDDLDRVSDEVAARRGRVA